MNLKRCNLYRLNSIKSPVELNALKAKEANKYNKCQRTVTLILKKPETEKGHDNDYKKKKEHDQLLKLKI